MKAYELLCVMEVLLISFWKETLLHSFSTFALSPSSFFFSEVLDELYRTFLVSVWGLASSEPKIKSAPWQGAHVSHLCSSGSQSGPILPPWDIRQCQEPWLVVVTGSGAVPLASSGWRPGLLLHILRPQDPPQTMHDEPQMSVVGRPRNPALLHSKPRAWLCPGSLQATGETTGMTSSVS